MAHKPVKLYSFNGALIRHVTLKQALEMIAEDLGGNEVEGLERVARRLTRKKAALTEIKMLAPVQMKDGDPCTLTRSDMEGNAIARADHELRGTGKYADRAASKVEAWPDTHDDRAPVISAGFAFGVFCPWPASAERVLTFA